MHTCRRRLGDREGARRPKAAIAVATEARSLSALIAPSTATDASQAVRDRLTQPACAANYYVCVQGRRMTALLLYAKDL
jgi:hypothetical protein